MIWHSRFKKLNLTVEVTNKLHITNAVYDNFKTTNIYELYKHSLAN